MKVLMLGWEFPPFKSGGLGTYLYGFTKSLAAKGTNITFVMPSTGVKINPGFINVVQAEDYNHLDLVEIKGFGFHPYIPSLSLDYEERESLDDRNSADKSINAYGMDFFQKVRNYTSSTVKRMVSTPCDIIHCHDWMTFPAGIALKERKSKPLVVTIHSTEFDRTGNISPNRAICEVERNGLHKADKVITISNYMKQQLIERYQVPENKIQVVYNGIDKSSYIIKEKTSFPLDEKIVLFLGRLTIQKGPDWFLEAAYQTLQFRPNTRFVVVGDGDMLPQLINKAIAMGISDKIIFSGFQDDVRKYYAIADLFVMPSVSEPFGLTALEAMASNTPIIISKQSGVSEVIRHCFKVDFWDSHEMANKIIGILDHVPLSTELKKNAFTELQGFSWDNVADQCLQIYKELS